MFMFCKNKCAFISHVLVPVTPSGVVRFHLWNLIIVPCTITLNDYREVKSSTQKVIHNYNYHAMKCIKQRFQTKLSVVKILI